ncbi:hypothetical protein GQ53DRAFT_57634 [Thozetella sp. PMI_491]|nr:hypothetical protein GQ53DRAFT_57634 [Thozetella sp. PMI_491]
MGASSRCAKLCNQACQGPMLSWRHPPRCATARSIRTTAAPATSAAIGCARFASARGKRLGSRGWPVKRKHIAAARNHSYCIGKSAGRCSQNFSSVWLAAAAREGAQRNGHNGSPGIAQAQPRWQMPQGERRAQH